MRPNISKSEREYIRGGCESDIRVDGRKQLDFRAIFVENNIFPHLNGSSRVKIADAVEVVCGVKAEVMEGSSAEEGGGSGGVLRGKVEVSVDISPTCNLRGDDRRNAELASCVASVLTNIIVSSGSIDLDGLVIVEGKSAWCLYIDLVVLQTDDGIYDACGLAAAVALQSTRIPDTKKIVGESEKYDFEVIGDLCEAKTLAERQQLRLRSSPDPTRGGSSMLFPPLVISVLKVGNALIVDGSNDEWCTASSALVVGVDESGRTSGITKVLDGAMTVEQIKRALEIASGSAKSINDSLKRFYELEIFEKDNLFADRPPVRIGLLS